MKIENSCLQFIILFIVSTSQQDVNVCSNAFRNQLSKSGLLHLTGQLKSSAAKVKDGIRNLNLGDYPEVGLFST